MKEELFIQKLKNLFPDRYEQIVQHLQEPKRKVFRVNTLKADPLVVLKDLKEQGFGFEKTPVDGAYIVNESSFPLSETKAFLDGTIYIQSLSSMLPVFLLDPQPEEKIVDMCSAPGSKTSLIAQLTGNQTELTSIENNRNRFFALKNNLENLGVQNVNVFLDNAKGFDRVHPEFTEYFDKVLLDAPCSNEGNICFSNPKTIEKWNPKSAKNLSQLQRGLIDTAYRLIKPGGIIVYSTCTFSREENHEVVEWLIKRHPETKVISMEQIFPDEFFTGFFIAKLQKFSSNQ